MKEKSTTYPTTFHRTAAMTVYKSEEEKNFTSGKVFVDGVEVEKGYRWTIDELNDCSVVKCYVTKDPKTFSAEIAADNDVEFSVVKDRIVEVEDLTVPINDLVDTEIEIIPAEGQKLSITISSADAPARSVAAIGNMLAPNEEGKYILLLDGNKKVEVKKNSESGIENIAGTENEADVYTTTGILVIRSASKSQIEALPAGIYVVGGKKIVK